MNEQSDPTLPPIVQRPERLTQRKILEKLLEGRARAASSHSSVRLSRGLQDPRKVSIEVMIATDPDNGIADAEAAASKAREIYDALALVYSYDPPAASS
jgi:hypothetical protein